MIRVYSEVIYNEQGKEIPSNNKLFVKITDVAKFIDSNSFCLDFMIKSDKPDTIGIIPQEISVEDMVAYIENKINNPRWEAHTRGWRKDRVKALLQYLKYMLNKPKKLKCINEF